MCAKGWQIPRYNPAGIRVLTYEMQHEPDRFNPRGGPNTADHVDILGRSSLNDLILRVVGGKGHLVEEHVVSRIREYAEKVRVWEDEDWKGRRVVEEGREDEMVGKAGPLEEEEGRGQARDEL
jgi:phospholipid:diacylglycerol acyltransferase